MSLRYVFVGNRAGVLEAMLDRGLAIGNVFAVTGSWLERWCNEHGQQCEPILDRDNLTDKLQKSKWDVLVSNGCPVIFPPELLTNPARVLVNIHPSLLPDLRGRDPVQGALLHGRPSGATCHRIDAEVDHGPIISRVPIPWTADLDARLLWQLVFRAEREVFHLALERNFTPAETQSDVPGLVSYRIDERDREMRWDEGALNLVLRIRAFNTLSRAVRISWALGESLIRDASIIDNPYLRDRQDQWCDREVVIAGESFVVVRLTDGFVRLELWDRQAVPSVGSVLA